jgi:hypothetical protein
LSEAPKGYSDDELSSYRDFVGRIEGSGTQVDVLLQRGPRGDGLSIWKFSNVTVAQVPELYVQFGFGQLGERLAALARTGRVLGVPLWEWTGIAILIPAALLIAWFSGWFFRGRPSPDTAFRSRFDPAAISRPPSPADLLRADPQRRPVARPHGRAQSDHGGADGSFWPPLAGSRCGSETF